MVISRDLQIDARMPLRLGRAKRSSPVAAYRCAEGAGLDGAGAAQTTIRRAEMTKIRGSPVTEYAFDLPEVTAFSSRFDAVVGAG